MRFTIATLAVSTFEITLAFSNGDKALQAEKNKCRTEFKSNLTIKQCDNAARWQLKSTVCWPHQLLIKQTTNIINAQHMALGAVRLMIASIRLKRQSKFMRSIIDATQREQRQGLA